MLPNTTFTFVLTSLHFRHNQYGAVVTVLSSALSLNRACILETCSFDRSPSSLLCGSQTWYRFTNKRSYECTPCLIFSLWLTLFYTACSHVAKKKHSDRIYTFCFDSILNYRDFKQDGWIVARCVRFCMGNPYSAANVRLGWLLL